MQRLFKGKEPTPIDRQITAVVAQMETVGVTHETYPTLMKHLKELYEIKKVDEKDLITGDTIAVVAVSFVETMAVIIYERAHVITSVRGWGQRIRPKTPG